METSTTPLTKKDLEESLKEFERWFTHLAETQVKSIVDGVTEQVRRILQEQKQ